MDNLFNKINISSSEYEYIKKLDLKDRLYYLFDMFDIERVKEENPGLNLQEFFESLSTNLNEDNEDNEMPNDPIDWSSLDDMDRVDVMIDEQNILIESNSLKALRIIRNRFIEDGYILRRDQNSEKMFRKDKVTKYIRIFRIIDQGVPLCWS